MPFKMSGNLLLAHPEVKGCQVVVWEGGGKPCYMRDPYGFVFNLWEAPEEFQD